MTKTCSNCKNYKFNHPITRGSDYRKIYFRQKKSFLKKFRHLQNQTVINKGYYSESFTTFFDLFLHDTNLLTRKPWHEFANGRRKPIKCKFFSPIPEEYLLIKRKKDPKKIGDFFL